MLPLDRWKPYKVVCSTQYASLVVVLRWISPHQNILYSFGIRTGSHSVADLLYIIIPFCPVQIVLLLLMYLFTPGFLSSSPSLSWDWCIVCPSSLRTTWAFSLSVLFWQTLYEVCIPTVIRESTTDRLGSICVQVTHFKSITFEIRSGLTCSRPYC